MYGLKVSSLIALAIAVPQVLATPPACLLACVSQVEKQSSCDSLSDFSCICSTEYTAVESCLDKICPNGNADAAKAAFKNSCGSKAAVVSSSSTSSTSTTSSSTSTTPTSTSTTPTSTSSTSTDAPTTTSTTSSSAATPATTSSSEAVTSAVTSAPAPSTLVTSASSSTTRPAVTLSAGANEFGKPFGAAAAVIGLVGALL